MEGKERPPFEWVVSRVCEDYGCTPSVALVELGYDRRDVSDLLLYRIHEYRAYADCHRQFQEAESGPVDHRDKAIERLRKHPGWERYGEVALVSGFTATMRAWRRGDAGPDVY